MTKPLFKKSEKSQYQTILGKILEKSGFFRIITSALFMIDSESTNQQKNDQHYERGDRAGLLGLHICSGLSQGLLFLAK